MSAETHRFLLTTPRLPERRAATGKNAPFSRETRQPQEDPGQRLGRRLRFTGWQPVLSLSAAISRETD